MKFDNPVIEAIYTRRSVRNYIDKKVPKHIINKLLNAAVMAPSARNTQPWNFFIIEDKQVMKMLAELAGKASGVLGWAVKTGMKMTTWNNIFYNAPLLILITGEKSYNWLKEDVNLAVQNMFLAAKSYNIGSCWIGLGTGLNNSIQARDYLSVPKNHEISAVLIFGYPSKLDNKIPKRSPKIKKWIK